MSPQDRIRLSVVRLISGAYSQEQGSLGVIEDTDTEGKFHFVAWIDGRGSSGPIAERDLLPVGEVSLPASQFTTLVANNQVGTTTTPKSEPTKDLATELGFIAARLGAYWWIRRGLRKRGAPKWAVWALPRVWMAAASWEFEETKRLMREREVVKISDTLDLRAVFGGWSGSGSLEEEESDRGA